jgi:diguanylate cyclase (GGDEF)-like protein
MPSAVQELDAARRTYWEDAGRSLAVAVDVHERARAAGDSPLRARALALQGACSLHRGDLHGALALAAEGDLLAGECLVARTELAALKSHLNFFSGSYAAALAEAELAVELADLSGELLLRVFARRMSCVVFGNMGVASWPERLEALLEMTIETAEPWEEAMSRNDLAHLRMEQGDLAEAEAELARAEWIARGLAPLNHFALGVVHCTRAEVRLNAGRHEAALSDADRSVGLLIAMGEPNPYLLGMAVLVKVQVLTALGRVDDVLAAGEEALERLADRVPQARSMILGTIAASLREAGRAEQAYDVLLRCVEVERTASRELSELQLGLERARIEMELLRDQAERDPLTGLHNRRYLDRAGDGVGGPVALAVLDIDHFKTVNDRYGHEAGDRVLVRVAELLREHVRAGDVVARTGGEEFWLLMPHTGDADALACCERVGAALREESWEGLAPGLRITASLGVVCAPDATDLRALARDADERLYAAKRAGRDRAVSD